MEFVNSGTLEGAVEIDLNKLGSLQNANVRSVALLAKESKERSERDSSYNLHGTYSEAYQGER
ncbi:MAG: hypothetical protein AABY15_06070 [Nanoarchaeota archaeon]